MSAATLNFFQTDVSNWNSLFWVVENNNTFIFWNDICLNFGKGNMFMVLTSLWTKWISDQWQHQFYRSFALFYYHPYFCLDGQVLCMWLWKHVTYRYVLIWWREWKWAINVYIPWCTFRDFSKSLKVLQSHLYIFFKVFSWNFPL